MTMVGLVLAVTFVACVSVVLAAIADVARPTPQGGSVAVAPGWRPAGIPAAPRCRPTQGYVGRHRR